MFVDGGAPMHAPLRWTISTPTKTQMIMAIRIIDLDKESSKQKTTAMWDRIYDMCPKHVSQGKSTPRLVNAGNTGGS